ncbi:MAG: hypothetical protein JJ879_08140 [Sneathiella sp.]|nr:hypothetical protein [Sneathiella sp.]
MADSEERIVNVREMAERRLNGVDGYGSPFKMRKLGYDGYLAELEEKLAAQIARASNDPRKKKS